MRHSPHPGASLSAFFCPLCSGLTPGSAGCLVTGTLVVTSHRAPALSRAQDTALTTHMGHIMRIGLLVIVTCQHLVMAQEPVKLGEIVHNLIFPSEQLMGTSHHQHPVSSRFPSKQVLDQI